MITQIADKHALKEKYSCLFFKAPNCEPNHVYLDISDTETIEIDTDAIIELGKKLEIRKNRLREVGKQ